MLTLNHSLSRALEHIAAQLEHEWCECATLTLADLALASALIYLDLRQPERDWRTAHPNLAAWFARISQRDSVRASLSE